MNLETELLLLLRLCVCTLAFENEHQGRNHCEVENPILQLLGELAEEEERGRRSAVLGFPDPADSLMGLVLCFLALCQGHVFKAFLVVSVRVQLRSCGLIVVDIDLAYDTQVSLHFEKKGWLSSYRECRQDVQPKQTR